MNERHWLTPSSALLHLVESLEELALHSPVQMHYQAVRLSLHQCKLGVPIHELLIHPEQQLSVDLKNI
jgi:hypothetical protein